MAGLSKSLLMRLHGGRRFGRTHVVVATLKSANHVRPLLVVVAAGRLAQIPPAVRVLGHDDGTPATVVDLVAAGHGRHSGTAAATRDGRDRLFPPVTAATPAGGRLALALYRAGGGRGAARARLVRGGRGLPTAPLVAAAAHVRRGAFGLRGTTGHVRLPRHRRPGRAVVHVSVGVHDGRFLHQYFR